MRNYFILLSILFFVGTACNIEPQAINYDEDECQRCKMIISNAQFGAELITKKGRIYKYDAIECLIPALLEKGEAHYSHMLVTDHGTPHQFTPASEAYYLISPQLPSPMGGYLSAYPSSALANKARTTYQGEVYSWNEITAKFNKE